ncbi:hypothetical protein [macacine gammaherpesvirus 13]|uniref:Uncharacterized protein n=1 Tax=macacine gammaherpesvirus 13 TaxID=2341050 RepID=A0A3G1T4G6_9GAMA|nr:hypothetical protein QKT43_gp57 [Macaca arctoides gammaherpesvirus 1]AYA49842.1 hypothetical protein [Macaca arctoides gammaherpesvirus 1]
MLYASQRGRLAENLRNALQQDSATQGCLGAETPSIMCTGAKSDRWAHPLVGTIHSSNLYCPMLRAYCRQYGPRPVFVGADATLPMFGASHAPTAPAQAQMCLLPELRDTLQFLLPPPSLADSEALTEFKTSVSSTRAILEDPRFVEMREFVTSLASFLGGQYKHKPARLEAFQKQVVLHSFYFLISIKSLEITDTMFDIFQSAFGLEEMTLEKLHIFKQKASVFLIPRRHGKTWIVVAIISLIISNLSNVQIGYVAHQKHVASAVFTEIIDTLTKNFDAKRVEVNKETSTITFRHSGKISSTVMCATCFNKNSIRGQTFHLLFVDEANFIKKEALPAILGFMLQKDAKIIFISSVNSADQATSFLYKLKDAQERLLNVVSYVCQEHRQDFDMQDSMVSCPCFRLHIPSYITMDSNIRATTNLFLDGAFSTELMGDTSSLSHGSLSRTVRDDALNQLELCRVDTLNPQVAGRLAASLYVYVDPAYTNNTSASGTGIAAVTHDRAAPDRVIVLGLEHFFLKDLTGDAALQIATCAVALISSIATLHPHLEDVKIAVEGNSSQDSAVAIASIIAESCPLPCAFVHTKDKTSSLQWPMYLLTNEKAKAFERLIYAVNTASLSASQVTVSNTIQLSFDPVLYLISQIRAIKPIPLRDGTYTYTGKQRNLSDDVLVALVMAHFLATTQRHSFKKVH